MRLGHDETRPLGLVLSGGGARGAFQVGVWKVLRDDPRGLGREPDVVSGTSAGAINGTLIAAGLSPEQMLEFWLDLSERPPIAANPRFFEALRRAVTRIMVSEPGRSFSARKRDLSIMAQVAKKHALYTPSGILAAALEILLTARFDAVGTLLEEIDTPFLFDTTPLRGRLAAAIGGFSVPRGRVKLALNAIDVRSGGVVRIVNAPPGKSAQASRHYRYVENIPLDLVLASASIPLLFRPVSWENRLLWDGGLLVNSPMAPAVALGARTLVPVLVTKLDGRSGAAMTSFGESVERLVDTLLENAYNIDRKLLLARNEIVGRIEHDATWSKVELLSAIRPGDTALFGPGSYLHFERQVLLDMYEAGKKAARDWLAAGPPSDDGARD
ncbi:MAG: patatin-like phospholipase family protein [Myxococcales bacterium]|nr:patatin-like phospholipase family protein [Myxococcales bacterium]